MEIFFLIALFVVGWSNAMNISWHKFGQEEYFISTSITVDGINNASAECQKLNGSLVIIKDNETQEFLVRKIGHVPRYPFAFYIGLRRFKNTSDGFIWDDGASVTSRPTHWYPGEPNNYMGKNEGCVTMGLQTNSMPFLWYDEACNLPIRIICQRSLVRRTKPVVTTASISSSPTHNPEKSIGATTPSVASSATLPTSFTSPSVNTPGLSNTVIYIIVGCVVGFVLLVVLLVICCWWRKRQRSEKKAPEVEMNVYETPIQAAEVVAVPDGVYNMADETNNAAASCSNEAAYNELFTSAQPNATNDTGYGVLQAPEEYATLERNENNKVPAAGLYSKLDRANDVILNGIDSEGNVGVYSQVTKNR
uniref:uncharacterized protein LOC100182345 isoform X1 n=1 Tax=Ciona intestinalis TaxID=7719 RepID=UPI000EF4E497|nr:uncharacterized protein LOC100182345 isoform X1 [Ciona intestinalis]|eukprot:XP_026690488.1 uncharacterized protein LOC100182345 isoform X1 [Ciona intestinalis]